MSDDVTPQVSETLEDDNVERVPEPEEKAKPLYSEQLSKVAMSLFPQASPIFVVNVADGSILYHSEHSQRFGAENSFEVFRAIQTAHTRATGDWARLIPMLKRINFSLSPFHLLLDESTPELKLLSRDFIGSFPIYNSVTRVAAKQVTVMQAITTPVEPRIAINDVEWIAFSAITATNGDNARTFVTYRHHSVFKGDAPETAAAVPTAKIDLQEQADLASALLTSHAATFQLGAVTAEPSSSWDKPKEMGERLHDTHREFGLRYIKKDSEFSLALYGKTKISVKLTRWQQHALDVDAVQHVIDGLRDQDVGYFSSNAGDWIVVDLLVREGVLTLDPRLTPLIERALDLAYIVTTPTLPLPIAMRLGWLTDEPKVECKQDDPEKGFTAGYFYGITSANRESWDEYTIEEEDPKTGRVVSKRKRRPKKWMQFRVTNDHDKVVPFDDDSIEDIRFLAEHFVIRDPGHQATRFPEKTFKMLAHVDAVEKQFLVPRGFKLEVFQKYDLAIGLAKKDYVLAHEMGLGKTLEILTYITVCVTKLGAKPAALVVTRKDLIPQWCDEAEKFYGFKLKVLDGTAPTGLSGLDRRQWQLQEYGRVRALKDRIATGEEKGIWITSYYDLAQTMKRTSDEHGWFAHSPTREWDEQTQQEEWNWHRSGITCPVCAKRNDFKTQSVCSHRLLSDHDIPGKYAKSRTRCGYTHHEIRLRTYGNLLSVAFRHGIIALDEATEISGADSQQGQAVMGLRAAYRLAATGTPVKNYIGQAFNILGWTLGFTSSKKKNRHKQRAEAGDTSLKPIRWPYPYGQSGRTAFEEKYAVYEQHLNKDGAWTGKKPVAATLQNSRLWRETAPIIVARRKEETGVKLPPKKFHTLQVPLGVYQREQMNRWRVDYPKWKAEQDAKEGKNGLTQIIGQARGLGALLGLESKLNWGCVLPCGDDDHEWTEVPVSDWTPMMFKSIETTMKLVAMGKKVVVGSDTPKAVEFISDALEQRGVKTVCLSKNGTSLSPRDRPDLIKEFQDGPAKVLCASMRSIEMGHNIDAASAMVIHGLVWDYKTFHQFENRIHRWSSKNPVDIFVVLPGEESHTLVGRKWRVLKDKTAGIAKALHGELDLIEDEKPDTDAILKDLIKHGIPTLGNEIPEAEVQAGFERMPHISAFERDQEFEDTLATWEDAQDGDLIFNPKAYVSDKQGEEFITHGEIADALEAFFKPWVLAEAQEEHDRQSAFYQLLIQLQSYFRPLGENFKVDEFLLRALDISWQTSLDVAVQVIRDQAREAHIDLSPLDPPAPAPEPEPEVEPETEPVAKQEPEQKEAPAPIEEEKSTPAIDLVAQIRGLKELMDEGILDEDEFREAKRALIESLKGEGVAA